MYSPPASSAFLYAYAIYAFLSFYHFAFYGSHSSISSTLLRIRVSPNLPEVKKLRELAHNPVFANLLHLALNLMKKDTYPVTKTLRTRARFTR